MMKVYEAGDRIDAQLCHDYLADRGVRTHVQGMDLLSAAGELPPDLPVSVWVVDDRDYRLALDLVEEYRAPMPAEAREWRCSRCGELIEAQFSICWNCGASSSR